MGGIHPPDKVPYAVNQDVFRAFQSMRVWTLMKPSGKSLSATPAALAGRLVRAWRLMENAYRRFMPLPLYSGYGMVWTAS